MSLDHCGRGSPAFPSNGLDAPSLLALLAEHRLVTVIGPGGCGRTTLARYLAAPADSHDARQRRHLALASASGECRMGIEDRLAAVVRAAVTEGFSGVIAVDLAGAPVLRSAAGLADRARGVANEVSTRMRVASVSKLITAAAVLRHVAKGDLRLDQPIGEVVDVAVSLPVGVTTDRLLTMTAGIEDWFDEDVEDVEAAWDELRARHPLHLLREGRDYLHLFIDQPLRQEPGKRWRYSNASYVLLGLALEAVTGSSYLDAVQSAVLEPAGMVHTDLAAVDDLPAGVAEGYLPDGRRNVLHVTPVGAGDGGMVSDAEDLLALCRALRDPDVLGVDVVEAMAVPMVRMREDELRGHQWWFGRGAEILRSPSTGETTRWGKMGEEDGVSARLHHHPIVDADVVVLSNVSMGSGKLASDLHDALVGR